MCCVLKKREENISGRERAVERTKKVHLLSSHFSRAYSEQDPGNGSRSGPGQPKCPPPSTSRARVKESRAVPLYPLPKLPFLH